MGQAALGSLPQEATWTGQEERGKGEKQFLSKKRRADVSTLSGTIRERVGGQENTRHPSLGCTDKLGVGWGH